jgi:hypothetical protein
MNPFFPKSKKLARLKAARKQMPKASRAFFVTLMVAVALHFQGQLLNQGASQKAPHAEQVELTF